MAATLCKVLKPRFDALRLETNRTGTPDVNLIGGWIECKFRPHWPKRKDTPVVFPHPWTQGQKVWARRRIRAGGSVWLCAKVHRSWFFFHPMQVQNTFGTMSKQAMVKIASLHMPNNIEPERLRTWIQVNLKG